MRALIVEDNAFNAFCLTRVLQLVHPRIQVIVANDSLSALNLLEQEIPTLVILDGDLGASDGLLCNGPVLADTILQSCPHLPLIVWSDSEIMRNAFAEVFKQHNKCMNEFNCWPKVVNEDRIRQSLLCLLPQFVSKLMIDERIALTHSPQ